METRQKYFKYLEKQSSMIKDSFLDMSNGYNIGFQLKFQLTYVKFPAEIRHLLFWNFTAHFICHKPVPITLRWKTVSFNHLLWMFCVWLYIQLHIKNYISSGYLLYFKECKGRKNHHDYCTETITNSYINWNHADLLQCKEENDAKIPMGITQAKWLSH